MSTTGTITHDYTTGAPRRHHTLYLEDGNFVIQAENAIFKVHRSVLVRYSNVIKDMLSVPQGENDREGTDERPLVLTGDSVVAWELLLGWQYESPRFSLKHALLGEQVLSILSIAHKYCMVKIEENILEVLNDADSTAEYVDLLVAARIVGSDASYKKALDALKTSEPKPDLAQAMRIGSEAIHAILTATEAALVDAKTKLASGNVQCPRCNYTGTRWFCRSCNQDHY